MGGDDENGSKRRETRRLGPAHRYIFFTFVRIFLILTNVLFVNTGFNQTNTHWRGRWKPATTKTGPNDARRVVWAISTFF
jgi:hypothetical protein